MHKRKKEGEKKKTQRTWERNKKIREKRRNRIWRREKLKQTQRKRQEEQNLKKLYRNTYKETNKKEKQ